MRERERERVIIVIIHFHKCGYSNMCYTDTHFRDVSITLNYSLVKNKSGKIIKNIKYMKIKVKYIHSKI